MFSGKIDVLPSERRDLGRRIGRWQLSIARLAGDDLAHLPWCSRIDDAGDPVMLTFGGTVADFAAADLA